MQDTSKKKQVGFRLDEELVECLEYMSLLYPLLSSTDVVDLIIKNFFYTLNANRPELASLLDQAVGKYMRGELDFRTRDFYINIVKPAKKRASS